MNHISDILRCIQHIFLLQLYFFNVISDLQSLLKQTVYNRIYYKLFEGERCQKQKKRILSIYNTEAVEYFTTTTFLMQTLQY